MTRGRPGTASPTRGRCPVAEGRRRLARAFLLAPAILAVVLTACIAPPLPSESIDVAIDLEPGASQTLSYRTTVVSEEDGFIAVSMTPTPETLAASGIEASLHSTINGEERLERWPDSFDDARVGPGMTHVVDFEAKLTNPGLERQSVESVIRVSVNSGDVPQPFPDEVSITLTER